MKNFLFFASTLFTLISCRYNDHQREQFSPDETAFGDFLFQYSIIDALLAGVYDGNLTVGDLKRRGDFGIGTFNGLDGEMIVTDGKVLKMRHNGEVIEVPDTEKTPLAYVKFFEADTILTLYDRPITYNGLKEHLFSLLNENKMYAIRLTGNFRSVEARSVAPAPKPYPELAGYLASGGQTSFNFSDTKGTCIGFIAPEYTARANIPGYHLHYISENHQKGGHVFEFQADTLIVEIDYIRGFTVEMNTHKDYEKADLNKNRKQELKAVEQKQ